jgi:hypothetical protein
MSQAIQVGIDYPLDRVHPSNSMWLFMLTKPRPKLIGPTCQSDQRVCNRPVWGDGRVDGEWYGLCSRCWHEHNAFHGHYVTLQANPAAAKLDGTGIQRLTFGDLEGWPTDWAGYDDALND